MPGSTTRLHFFVKNKLVFLQKPEKFLHPLKFQIPNTQFQTKILSWFCLHAAGRVLAIWNLGLVAFLK